MEINTVNLGEQQRKTIRNYDERQNTEYSQEIAEVEKMMDNLEHYLEGMGEEIKEAISNNEQIQEHLGRSGEEEGKVMSSVRKAHGAIDEGNLKEAREHIGEAEQHTQNFRGALNTIENELKREMEELEVIEDREQRLEDVEKELEVAEKNLQNNS